MSGLLILLAVAALLLIAILTAMLAHEMVHPPRQTAAYAVAHHLPVDPADLGLEFEEWALDRPDGVRLSVWEIKGRRAEAENEFTAVGVHDWGESRIDSLARCDALLPLANRLVLYDLRGHGESAGTSRMGCGEIDDLIALCERLGPTNLLLVGRGMGAVIALHAAERLGKSACMAGVIAEAPYADFQRIVSERVRRAAVPTWPILDLALLVHRTRGVRPLCADEALIAHLTVPKLVCEKASDADVVQFVDQLHRGTEQ